MNESNRHSTQLNFRSNRSKQVRKYLKILHHKNPLPMQRPPSPKSLTQHQVFSFPQINPVNYEFCLEIKGGDVPKRSNLLKKLLELPARKSRPVSSDNALISHIFVGSLHAALVTSSVPGFLGGKVSDVTNIKQQERTSAALINFQEMSSLMSRSTSLGMALEMDQTEVFPRADGQIKVIYLDSTDTLVNLHELVQ